MVLAMVSSLRYRIKGGRKNRAASIKLYAFLPIRHSDEYAKYPATIASQLAYNIPPNGKRMP
jgi:hypothetical protein